MLQMHVCIHALMKASLHTTCHDLLIHSILTECPRDDCLSIMSSCLSWAGACWDSTAASIVGGVPHLFRKTSPARPSHFGLP